MKTCYAKISESLVCRSVVTRCNLIKLKIVHFQSPATLSMHQGAIVSTILATREAGTYIQLQTIHEVRLFLPKHIVRGECAAGGCFLFVCYIVCLLVFSSALVKFIPAAFAGIRPHCSLYFSPCA